MLTSFFSGVSSEMFMPDVRRTARLGRLSRLTWGPEAAVVLVEKTSSCSAASFKDEDRCINEHLRDPRWSGDGPAVIVMSSGDLLSLGKHFVASSDECKKYLPAAVSL